MKSLVCFSLILFFCQISFSSLSNTWNLNKGELHPLFKNGESIRSLEEKVFSPFISFKKRWLLVKEVSDLKTKKESLVFLKKCLNQKEWFLQSAALKVLIKRHSEDAVKLAQSALLNSKALVVRSDAVSVVESLGGPEDTEILWKALNQKQNFRGRQSLWIRPQIAKTILFLERSKRSKKWESLLTDSNETVRSLAKKAVSRIN